MPVREPEADREEWPGAPGFLGETYSHPRGNWYIVTDVGAPSVQSFTLYNTIDIPGFRYLEDDESVEFECEPGAPEATLPYRTTWVRPVRE